MKYRMFLLKIHVYMFCIWSFRTCFVINYIFLLPYILCIYFYILRIYTSLYHLAFRTYPMLEPNATSFLDFRLDPASSPLAKFQLRERHRSGENVTWSARGFKWSLVMELLWDGFGHHQKAAGIDVLFWLMNRRSLSFFTPDICVSFGCFQLQTSRWRSASRALAHRSFSHESWGSAAGSH